MGEARSRDSAEGQLNWTAGTPRGVVNETATTLTDSGLHPCRILSLQRSDLGSSQIALGFLALRM